MRDELTDIIENEVRWESELEVVFSLMDDAELLKMFGKLNMMIEEKAYQVPRFPLSSGGIRWVQAIVMFTYWCRRGKGVRIVEGKIVVCELGDSPFVKKYEKDDFLLVEEEEVVVGRMIGPKQEQVIKREEGGAEWV